MKKSLLAALALVTLVAGSGLAFAGDAERSGGWTKKSQSIAGAWSIVEQDGRLHVRLDEEFKTRSAPDLKIFLSRDDLKSLNGDNATRNSVLVAPLRSAKGAQSYPIPEGLDLSGFKSLIIHCEQYAKLWGGSAL